MGKITVKNVQNTEDRRAIPVVDVKPEIDEDPVEQDGLTIRQRLFVVALTGAALGNKTKAAEMAGYASENRDALKVTASRLLTNANVAAAVDRAISEKCNSPEWAKNALISIARADMSNFLVVDDQGNASLDFERAAAAGALGQIKRYTEKQTDTGTVRTIELHDRGSAVNTLLKMNGLLVDKVQHTGAEGGPIQVESLPDLSKLTIEEIAAYELLLAKTERPA